MTIFTFNSGIQGWEGVRINGTQEEPALNWDSGQGYPGLGSLRIDALDLVGSAPPYYSWVTFRILTLNDQYFQTGFPVSFWWRIQNRAASAADFRITLSLDQGQHNPVPYETIANIPGSSTSDWVQFIAILGSVSGTINEMYVNIERDLDSDGFFSAWLDTVYLLQEDPTPPPPTTKKLKMSAKGLPEKILGVR